VVDLSEGEMVVSVEEVESGRVARSKKVEIDQWR